MCNVPEGTVTAEAARVRVPPSPPFLPKEFHEWLLPMRMQMGALYRLRDLYLPYRLRLIGVLSQFALQPIQLLSQLRVKHLKTLPIYASTTPVRFYFLPGHLQILPLVYLIHQSVDLSCSCQVDPVHQSPRTRMYGCFTHGPVPHPSI